MNQNFEANKLVFEIKNNKKMNILKYKATTNYLVNESSHLSFKQNDVVIVTDKFSDNKLWV